MKTEYYQKSVDKIGPNTIIDSNLEVLLFNRKPESNRGVFIGADCTIYSRNRFVLGDMQANPEANMNIGNHVMINSGCYISAEGGLEIHDYVLIGPNVNILSAGHNYRKADTKIQHQGLSYGKIIIGEDAWIGASSVILQDTTIGRGAVIGAGSVVTGDIPDMAVAVGSPARIIKYRHTEHVPSDCPKHLNYTPDPVQEEQVRLESEIKEIHKGYKAEILRLNTEIQTLHSSYQDKISSLHLEIKTIHNDYQKALLIDNRATPKQVSGQQGFFRKLFSLKKRLG